MILGIDEVGRGAWAGPLVVGAVVLGSEIEGLTDSKALSKKRREYFNVQIYDQASGIGLGWVSASEIDDIGLSEALRLATKRAVQDVGAPFHQIILDGTVNFLRGTKLESHVQLMKKADLLIPTVSAASIVAKVARDNYMSEQAALYPQYGLGSHVGYGTAAHRQAISDHGITPLHRTSIAPLASYRSQQSTEPTASEASGRTTTKAIGDSGETAACGELARRGYQVVERNWKTKRCEIDIVATKADCYYFVEVKHRKNDKSGDGLDAITPRKQRQMEFAAKVYAQKFKLRGVNMRLVAIATAGDEPKVTRFIEIKDSQSRF